MSQRNIEIFNKATLFILNHLYNNFPNKIDFNSFELANKELIKQTGSHLIQDGQDDPTDNGGELEFLIHLTNTIIWLKEEQYIRFDTYNAPHNFKKVVLSSKGLVLLEKPSSLDSNEKLIDSIKNEFKKGASSGLQKLGQQLIQSGVSKYLIHD